MRRQMLTATLTLLLLISCSVGAAQAADSLVYQQGGVDIAAVIERSEYGFKDSPVPFAGFSDTLKVSSTGYGGKLGFGSADIGLRAAVTVTAENVKANFDDFDLKGSGLGLAAELSQRLYKGDSGFSAGLYAKYKHYFPKADANVFVDQDGFIFPDDQGFGNFFGFRDRLELSKLWTAEIGLLVQQNWQRLEIYAGPLVQWVRADVDFVGEDLFFGGKERINLMKAKERSNFGGVLGAKFYFGQGFLGADVTFKDKTSVKGQLGYIF